MPWFFRRLGVKYMLLVGMGAWAARYLLFAVGVAGLMLALHGWARFFRASDYVVFGTAWPFVVDDHRSGPVCLRRLATRRTAGNDVKGPFAERRLDLAPPAPQALRHPRHP
jgi:hypothetical protein